jgi:hypothetical protein
MSARASSGALPLGLAEGLALAFRQLRANAPDAARFNAKLIGKEKGMLLLFLLSGASFGYVTNTEGRELKRERKIAAKSGGAAPAAAKPLVKSGKRASHPSFWTDLRYLLRIAFPNGPFSRGGLLLGSQARTRARGLDGAHRRAAMADRPEPVLVHAVCRAGHAHAAHCACDANQHVPFDARHRARQLAVRHPRRRLRRRLLR